MSENARSLVLVHNLEYSANQNDLVYLDESWKPVEKGAIFTHKNSFVMNQYQPTLPQEVHQKSQALEKKLLAELALKLNAYHGTSLSERAWRIILGHWLRMYSQIVCKYTIAIQKAYSEGVSEVYLNKQIADLETPLDTSEANYYFESKKTIEMICAETYQAMQKTIPCTAIPINGSKKLRLNYTHLNYKASLNEKIQDKIKSIMHSAGKYLVKNQDALIISTYLPISQEILLNLRLGQWPSFYTLHNSSQDINNSVDFELRKKLFSDYKPESVEERVAWSLIPTVIPLIFLENFQSTSEEIKERKFPPNPKLIFTANSFMNDETFKQFVAFQVDKGIPYFVAQHGNNYGTLLYTNPTIEEETCDHFISWGWKTGNAIPGFVIKNPKPRLRKRSHDKEDLLLIMGHKNFSSSIHDTEKEFKENVVIQRNFLNSLNVELIKKSTVRFHPYSLKNGENGLIKDVGNLGVKSINLGNSSIRPLIKQSRVVIHAYDSTGILETLSQNIPTMAFWHKESSPKLNSAETYYRMLEEVGIINYDSESMANFLNSNFEKIDEWWLSDKVQQAREHFCNEYARLNYKPVRTLTRILKLS